MPRRASWLRDKTKSPHARFAWWCPLCRRRDLAVSDDCDCHKSDTCEQEKLSEQEELRLSWDKWGMYFLPANHMVTLNDDLVRGPALLALPTGIAKTYERIIRPWKRGQTFATEIDLVNGEFGHGITRDLQERLKVARHDREWHEREGAKARAECNVLRSEKAKLEARLSEADAKLAVHEQRVQHGLDVLGVESIEKLVQRFTNEQKETDVDQRKNDRALSEPCTGRAFWQQRTYESQDEYGRKKLRMPQHKWRVTSTEPDAETEGAYWYEATCKCCLRTVRDWWPSASEALRSGMRFKRSALVGLGIPERTPMPYRVAGVGLRLAWGTLSTLFRWIFWPLKRVGKKFSGNASEGLKTAAVSVAVTAGVLGLVGSPIYFAAKRSEEKCFTPAAEGSAIGTITEVQSDGGSGYYLLYLDNGTRWRVRTEGARMLQVGDTGYVCKESLWHWKERPADEPGAKVDAERAEDF